MNKHIMKFLVVIVLLSASVIDVIAGGGRRNGSAGAQELLIPVGTKGIALKGAYISGIEGIGAIYFNPAGMGVTENSAEALFSHMTYIADIGVSYAAIAANFGSFGALGLSVKSIDFGEIPVTTVLAPEGTGSTFSPTFVTIGLTYSNALTDRIRVGINTKVISEKIIRTNATGIAFDAGVQYNGFANLDGLKFGVVLKNLGPQMKFDGPDLLRLSEDSDSWRGSQFHKIDAATFELPSQLELGISYEREFTEAYRLMISTVFQNNNFAHDEYKFAGEFGFNKLLFLRAGYSIVPDAEDQDEQNIFGPTFGAGIKFGAGIDIEVDYAYRWARYFDANHVISVKLGF